MRAWVAVALLGVAGCGSASEPSPVPVGRAFELSVAKTQDVGDGLRVTFNGVSEDSRCPTDAVCVWAGNAALQVTRCLVRQRFDERCPQHIQGRRTRSGRRLRGSGS